MQDEFENALAWFSAAPVRWMQSAKQDLTAAAEWIWGVLQGDFNEQSTTAQTITGMVISMIPFVDQLCDARDVVACCKRIHHDSDNTGNWVALALTLLGLFPTLGSLVKGCGKILFGYARKAALKTGTKAAETSAFKILDQYLEHGIVKLNSFLERPEVQKTLKALHWDNPYKTLATKIREWRGQVTVRALLSAFDSIVAAIKELLSLVQKWGGGTLGKKGFELLSIIDGVRKKADVMLGKVLKPVQDWMDRVARRLNIESDNAHRAYLNATNPHCLTRPTSDAEIAAFKKEKPKWVDKTKKWVHPPAERAPLKDGWPDLKPKLKAGERHPLKDAYKTFEEGKISSVTISPGETLYRIVDPGSSDNSICWMRKAEFDKLKSKDDWRRKFAVWSGWNSNGEFVTYTVPPGKGLNVWEGVVGTQAHRLNDEFKLEGGAMQIVLDPDDLKIEFLGKRQSTNWGYGNFDESADLTGVPVLTNNWYVKE
ncbi:hypothetical protein [Noviherbaspirillum sp.]|jgi:hypothetical protein|uniref:hypothetical protein n=1 Tax=Noviherbaspirillum sp. TaxID=1926288 RepID=UPI0025FD0475|nr:hypothetical protein [Noviherbaspirillum sp.]